MEFPLVFTVPQLILNWAVFLNVDSSFRIEVILPNWVELAAIRFQYDIPHSSRIYVGFEGKRS